MKYYYEIHIFHSHDNEIVVPLKIISHKQLNVNEVIKYALDDNLIVSDDVDAIVSIELITEKEYNDMTGDLEISNK